MKSRSLKILLVMMVGVALLSPVTASAVVWKMHHWRPATQKEVPYMQRACDEIKKLTEGRVTIEIYPGFSLGYPRSAWLRNIKAGVIDITCIYNAFTAGEEPSFTVLEMPQVWRTREQGLLAANAFFGYKEKVYREIWGGKLLAQGTILEGGREVIFTKGKQIKRLSDLKGLKIRVPGGRYRELFTKLGVAPQSIKLGKVYMAMKTGVIDGLRTGSGTVNQLKLYEVADKAVKLSSWGPLSQDIVVSQKAWGQISSDDQKTVNSVWKKWGTGMMAHVIHSPYVDDVYWESKNKAEGMTYTELPEEDLSLIRKTALKVLLSWVEKTGGRPAEAFEVIKPFILPQKEPGVPLQFSK